jgi:hypothetical protein
MCTVVVRWAPGTPTLVLALRDELVGREFDEPDEWWPEQPGVVGGRDRQAGGSWCVTDVASGVTALVLNRPQRRVAEPWAPSRGVLPLLAVQHQAQWPSHLDVTGMASFALVLAAPESLVLWEFDGARLRRTDLGEGIHMVTSGGAEDGKAGRHLGAFTAGAVTAQQWQDVVTASPVQDDRTALLVRHPHDGATFATVFGQVIDAEPGRLSLRWSREPQDARSWTSAEWPSADPLPPGR